MCLNEIAEAQPQIIAATCGCSTAGGKIAVTAPVGRVVVDGYDYAFLRWIEA